MNEQFNRNYFLDSSGESLPPTQEPVAPAGAGQSAGQPEGGAPAPVSGASPAALPASGSVADQRGQTVPVEGSAGGVDAETVILAQQALIDEYRKKYPDLQGYEDCIASEVGHVIRENLQRFGRLMTEREALEAGIDRFKGRMEKHLAEKRQHETNQQANRMAMNLDVNSAPDTLNKMTDDQIWSMPRDRFLKLDRELSRKYYL